MSTRGLVKIAEAGELQAGTETSGAEPTVGHPHLSDEERAIRFGAAIDSIKARVEAEIGDEDVRHLRWLSRFSLSCEAVGRVLIHVSFEPVLFSLGVLILALHKQLETTEIGHTIMHGGYDNLEVPMHLQKERYHWASPIDEASWRHAHNFRHHSNTNIVGRDPDINVGPFLRFTDRTPPTPLNRWQLPSLIYVFPMFGFLLNFHFTGVYDRLFGSELEKPLAPDTSSPWWRLMRKNARYYTREYVLFPALAGPFFWKIILGNFLASNVRDVFTACTIFPNHTGRGTKSYPASAKPKNRGEWYVMQVEATNNFEVGRVVSVLTGALDVHIEHHLFPKFPPDRLRQVAPEVRATCKQYGVRYHTGSWGAC